VSGPWAEGLPVATRRLLDEAVALRRRLERMTCALATGSAALAEQLDDVALARGGVEDPALSSKLWRHHADVCRDFLARFSDLDVTG
jgi:hypothetical protein